MTNKDDDIINRSRSNKKKRDDRSEYSIIKKNIKINK